MPIDQVSSVSNGATNQVSGLGTVTGTLQGGISNLINMGSNMLDRILPPPRREDLKRKLTRFATEKPYLASFLLSQIAFSGLPMFLFVILVLSVVIFALITGLVVGLLGAVLFILGAVGFALIVLLPTLFFTTFAAVGVWLFGVGLLYLVKHFGQRDVPVGDGVGKSTGLDGASAGLDFDRIDRKQNTSRLAQDRDGSLGVRGETEDLRGKEDGYFARERSVDDGMLRQQSVKRKAVRGRESMDFKRDEAGYFKPATSGVGGVANGFGSPVSLAS